MSRRDSKRRSVGSSGSLSRRSALALLGGGGLLAMSGSGAFDAVSADRAFTVDVSDDDEARLGIEIDAPTVTDGDSITVLRLTNGFGEAWDSITVSVLSSGTLDVTVEEILTANETVSPGDSIDVDATVSCDTAGTVPVQLEITASGPTESVTAVRTVEVTCESPDDGAIDITGVTFRGTGNVNPIASPVTAAITVDVWYYDGVGQPGAGSDEFDGVCGVQTSTNAPVQPDLPGGVSGIVAVYVHEADRSWHHPEFDPDSLALTNWGQGPADGIEWVGEDGETDIGIRFDGEPTCSDVT
ncbi:MAG: hypothetical protein ACQETB_07315 [Halobacteriota archaeon]